MIFFHWWSLEFSLSSAAFGTIVSPSLRGEPLGCVAAEEEEEEEDKVDFAVQTPFRKTS